MTSTAERILELKRQVEVMEAYERGENVEAKVRRDGNWLPILRAPPFEPTWDWGYFDYRVKPKKREVWLIQDESCIPEWEFCREGDLGCIRFVEAD